MTQRVGFNSVYNSVKWVQQREWWQRRGREMWGSDYKEGLWDLRWTWREQRIWGERKCEKSVDWWLVGARLRNFWNQRTGEWAEWGRQKVEAEWEDSEILKFVWLLTRARSMGGWGRAKDKIIGDEIKKVRSQGGEGSSTWIWKSPSIMAGDICGMDNKPGARSSKGVGE